MSILSSLIGIIALVSGLFAPVSAMAAIGFSFGGRIISPPVPCTNIPGAYLITIVPAGGDLNPFYVYTPGFTLGLPPSHPGQLILGVADIITGCNGILTAQRIQIDGVSL
jgi:hypothetical protein